MQEVICIDDIFSEEATRNIPNLPVEGHIYTIRQIFRNPDGSYGLYLNELKNPIKTIPTYLGNIKLEPNFAVWRFTKLSYDELSVAELETLQRENVKENEHER